MHVVDPGIQVQHKIAGAVHEEAHLVLVMRVLGEEFRTHRIRVRGGRVHLHHIGRAGAGGAHQPIQIGAVGRQDGLGIIFRGKLHRRDPSLEPHAERAQFIGNAGGILGAQDRLARLALGIDRQATHRINLQRSSSQASRNSSASSRAKAVGMSGPHT